MGMPVEFNTMIVTKGNEQRIDENIFQVTKEGYRIYPIDIPIEVRKTKAGEIAGEAIVEKLEIGENKTVVTYRLIALNSTN
ncbi:DUF2584 domain-containing protein [Metabacillus sediminilitoris]|jgi:hypothetical protein|uniref:DUF2584 domain-containing protein n=1 Tax=Metabacillus sediminilitoris TaxID=2567941 RepID=A0A4S4C4E4_9BACI|nr:DUF2584 domain-containing protein [Metabacillus sediminilitoris]QGQ47613.1 DUF2584 family protein [Metabacillus sediminilitoris]THF82047.1 DUF2584 domain-containing protein [Metabacillus sediminilitoris]